LPRDRAFVPLSILYLPEYNSYPYENRYTVVLTRNRNYRPDDLPTIIMNSNRRTLWLAIGTVFVFAAMRFGAHFFLPHAIDGPISAPLARCAILGLCLLTMATLRPQRFIGWICLVPLSVSLGELYYAYLYSHSVAGPGWNWRLCFWVGLNWLHWVALVLAWAALLRSWKEGEKTAYVLLGMLYLILVAWLFPFETVFRWASLMSCPGFGPF
jgi:hypothetical protein